MDSGTILQVEHLSKKFCMSFRRSMWYGLRDIAGELAPASRAGAAAQLRHAEFWGLQDVSFELKQGEALAVVGSNGAGKSTLLKLLNGLIKPDTGSIRVRGRVGALIELGVGLDPVLSGYENIFMRAALLGITRRQVGPLVEPIIEFAGLGDAVNMPVQFYSSGMAARLAYAVAAHLNPDLLLVDEVLAVGDMDFQRKCINHMLSYLAQGGSLVLVSHSAPHIQAVCGRGLLLNQGQLVFAGSGTDTLDRYFEQQMAVPVSDVTGRLAQLSPERPVFIERLDIVPLEAPIVQPGQAVRLDLHCHALDRRTGIGWAFHIWSGDHLICITGGVRLEPLTLRAGHNVLSCTLPSLSLTAGEYVVKVIVFEISSQQPLAMMGWEDAAVRLQVQAESSIEKNAQYFLRQLVTTEAQWE